MSNKRRRSNKAILLRPISVIIQSVPYPVRLPEDELGVSPGITDLDITVGLIDVAGSEGTVEFTPGAESVLLQSVVIEKTQPTEGTVEFTPGALGVNLVEVVVEHTQPTEGTVEFTPGVISVLLEQVVIETTIPTEEMDITPAIFGVALT